MNSVQFYARILAFPQKALYEVRREKTECVLDGENKGGEKYSKYPEFVEFIKTTEPSKVSSQELSRFMSKKKVIDIDRQEFLNAVTAQRKKQEDFDKEKIAVSWEQKEPNRFWQLIFLASQLIERVYKKRDLESHNLYFEREEEAYFVFQLLFEWSLAQQATPAARLALAGENFHGPEKHYWSDAPRIWHYNAGVWVDGKSRNTHLFFERLRELPSESSAVAAQPYTGLRS